MGGGIGGGSSNAATKLVALNHLWNTALSEDDRAELGLALGADVPIFVRGLTAFAGGVGEEITPAPQKEQYFLVANPNVHVSTAEHAHRVGVPGGIGAKARQASTKRLSSPEAVSRVNAQAKFVTWH